MIKMDRLTVLMEKFWNMHKIAEDNISGRRSLKPEAEKLAKELVIKNPTKQKHKLKGKS